MQVDALDAALKLILSGPADQPLMRVIRIAADAARCSAAFIGVRRENGFHIIASYGIPLTQYRDVLPRLEGIAAISSKLGIVPDARELPEFADHPFVAGPPHWRFVAFCPLPLPSLPYPVILYVADPRVDVERPAALLERLTECSAIAADQMMLIGDIALQSQSLSKIRSEAGVLADAVRKSPIRVALVDSDFIVRAVSARFAGLSETPADDQVGRSIHEIQLNADENYVSRLAAVMDSGNPLSDYVIRSYDGQKIYALDAFRCETDYGVARYLIVTVNEINASYSRIETLAASERDSPGVVSDFLRSTLIAQKRLLRRGPVPYHALYRWRSAVKDVQIAALKSLKRDPGDAFLDAVAEDMAAAAGALFGTGTFRAVVPVPCGNSGENCLSSRLAKLIAVRLGVDFIDAFEPLAPSGGSHPKGNLRRPAMQLKIKPKVPVLLIDDVATSGAHIEEAAQALRRTAPAVLPLVWIAD